MLDPSTLPPIEVTPRGPAGYVRQFYLKTNFYQRKLDASAKLTLNTRVPAFWPGNADEGNRFFQGRFRFSGREVRAPNQPPWRLKSDDIGWMSGLHGFDWLSDFAATGVDAARQHARALIRSWIDLCFDLDPVIWAPALAARRMMNWLVWWDFLAGDHSDERFQAAFELSLGRHFSYLQATTPLLPTGWAQLSACIAETAACLACDRLRGALDPCLNRLDHLLADQVLRDGVHVARSPSIQLRLIAELLFLAQLAAAIERQELAQKLATKAHSLSGFVEQLRDGEGDLIGFNGAYNIDSDFIDQLFRALPQAPHTPLSTLNAGFQRLTADTALLIFDGGLSIPAQSGLPGYASTGSFHFSDDGIAIIGNCGSGMGRPEDWQAAARRGLAHSCLCLNDVGCGEDLDQKRPMSVNCRRHETDENNIWLELSHNGFANRHNLLHQRRIYLKGDGTDLRGEDQLIAADRQKPVGTPSFRSAFHLHPDVKATATQDDSILLKLRNGNGWRFIADGGTLSLEESVYLAQPHEAVRSQQIVLSGQVRDDVKLRWALRKI